MPSVLITGCSKGIGYETALAFARAGYQVHATMRDPVRSPGLAETALREGLPISVSQMDVDTDESVSTAIASICEAWGAPDVLVNNAGIESMGSVEEVPLSEFRAIMETNYFGVLRCTKALLPEMRERRSGCIVNVSSIAGRLSCAPMSPYTGSKWALEALSEALAGEMKTFGVRVVLVEPGIIDTAMARRIGESAAESLYGQKARFAALFAGALEQPVPPSLVAGTIVEIVQSDSWTLRHLVGPSAQPFIDWRRQMSDEAWVDLNAGDDATFFAALSGPESK